MLVNVIGKVALKCDNWGRAASLASLKTKLPSLSLFTSLNSTSSLRGSATLACRSEESGIRELGRLCCWHLRRCAEGTKEGAETRLPDVAVGPSHLDALCRVPSPKVRMATDNEEVLSKIKLRQNILRREDQSPHERRTQARSRCSRVFSQPVAMRRAEELSLDLAPRSISRPSARQRFFRLRACLAVDPDDVESQCVIQALRDCGLRLEGGWFQQAAPLPP